MSKDTLLLYRIDRKSQGKFEKKIDAAAKSCYTIKADIQKHSQFSEIACVAQLVEQRIRNAQVAGSSPAASSKKTRYFERNNGFFVLFRALQFFQPASWCSFGVYVGVYNC